MSLSANGTASASDTAYAHVEMNLGSDLPIGNSQRTVEFWAFIKTTDWVGEKNEVYYYGGSANAGAFGLDFGTNPVMGMTNNHATLNPITGGGFNDDSTNDLGINSSADQWVHVAMVWNGTNVITYVNGLPKITTAGKRRHRARDRAVGCDHRLQPDQQQLLQWPVRRAAHLEGRAHGDADPRQLQQARARPTAPTWSATGSSSEASGTTTADAVTTAGHTAHNGTLTASATRSPRRSSCRPCRCPSSAPDVCGGSPLAQRRSTTHWLGGRRRAMRGAVLYGPRDVRFEERAAPRIVEPTDAVIRIAATCVCGSDLWPYRGISRSTGRRRWGTSTAASSRRSAAPSRSVKPGQFVIGSFFASDNTCPHCQAGYQSSCEHREFIARRAGARCCACRWRTGRWCHAGGSRRTT